MKYEYIILRMNGDEEELDTRLNQLGFNGFRPVCILPSHNDSYPLIIMERTYFVIEESGAEEGAGVD